MSIKDQKDQDRPGARGPGAARADDLVKIKFFAVAKAHDEIRKIYQNTYDGDISLKLVNIMQEIRPYITCYLEKVQIIKRHHLGNFWFPPAEAYAAYRKNLEYLQKRKQW